MLEGYENATKDYWHGRIDSHVEYDSFRWHQHIKLLDLNEELEASQNIEYVIVGYMVEDGTLRNKGRGGSKDAPNEVRMSLSNKPCSFPEDVQIYDGGNIHAIDNDVETAQLTLSIIVKKLLDAKMFPIIIGGGHDVSFGNMLGIFNKFSDKKVGVINFDAHFDNRPYECSTSGTMFRQIYDYNLENNIEYDSLTIGVQKSSNTVSLFNFANGIGNKYIMAREIYPANSYYNSKQIKKFCDQVEKIYVTVCADVFSSSYAPGVSSPQPLGMDPSVFMEFFKQIIDTGKVVSFDIAEAIPKLDVSNSTTSLVALIIYTIVNYYSENGIIHEINR